jgi:hypothetical protein
MRKWEDGILMPVRKIILKYYKPPDIDQILEKLIQENKEFRDVIQIYKYIYSFR